MSKIYPGHLFLVLIVVPFCSLVPQDRDLERTLRRLLQESAGPKEQERLEARRRLDELGRTAYAELYELRRKTSDQKLKKQIYYVLDLHGVKTASVILAGKIKKVERIQGGVVDYHKLIVHFESASELKPSKDKNERLGREATFEFAVGTSRDSWLCQLMQRDLERRKDSEVVWLLHKQSLSYGKGGGLETSFQYYEYRTLPKAAAKIIPLVLREKGQ